MQGEREQGAAGPRLTPPVDIIDLTSIGYRVLGVDEMPTKRRVSPDEQRSTIVLEGSREVGGIDAVIRATEKNETPTPDAPRVAVEPNGALAGGNVVLGQVVGRSPDGTPLVTLPGGESAPCEASSTVEIGDGDVGTAAALLVGPGTRPVVLGLLRTTLPPRTPCVEVSADGQRLVLSAGQEIELRCGSASITLTRDGRIRLRGVQILSRATGVNRIFGGSVQIN